MFRETAQSNISLEPHIHKAHREYTLLPNETTQTQYTGITLPQFLLLTYPVDIYHDNVSKELLSHALPLHDVHHCCCDVLLRFHAYHWLQRVTQRLVIRFQELYTIRCM